MSKFTEVTGKRDDYSINANFKSEDKTISDTDETIVENEENEESDDKTIEEKLIKLKNLFDKDLISESEYKERKKELLDLL